MHADRDQAAIAKEYAKHILKPPARMVDYGCGTGALSVEFQNLGYSVLGIEPSAAMRKVCANRDVMVRGGGFGVRLLNPRDCAVSTFAAFSYGSLSNSMLLHNLRGVRKSLHRHGRFVFDVLHTAGVAKSWWPESMGAYGEDVTYIEEYRDCEYDVKRSIIKRTCRFIARDREWTELHVMRTFSPPEISLALELTGFDEVTMLACPWQRPGGDDNLNILEDDWYFLIVAEAV